MGPSVCHSLTTPFADLTDVTLADEDTNSILTDNANGAIQGYEAMQVVPPVDKILNQDFNQISEFQPSLRISTKFQDFNQI